MLISRETAILHGCETPVAATSLESRITLHLTTKTCPQATASKHFLQVVRVPCDMWPLSPVMRQDLGSPSHSTHSEKCQLRISSNPQLLSLGRMFTGSCGLSICSPNYLDNSVLKAPIPICLMVLLLCHYNPIRRQSSCHDGPFGVDVTAFEL